MAQQQRPYNPASQNKYVNAGQPGGSPNGGRQPPMSMQYQPVYVPIYTEAPYDPSALFFMAGSGVPSPTSYPPPPPQQNTPPRRPEPTKFFQTSPQQNSAAVASATPPTRERKILVIRNPDTKEVINKDAVQSASASTAAAPAASDAGAAALPAGTAAKAEPAAEPSKPEPAKAEPAKPEPAKAEPAKAEPAKAEPAKAEPAKAEPAKAEPTKAEPAKAEPAKAEPAKAEPAKAEPAKAEPAKPEPAKAEPAKPEPAKAEPAKPEPLQVGSVVIESIKLEPPSDEPAPANVVQDGEQTPAEQEPDTGAAAAAKENTGTQAEPNKPAAAAASAPVDGGSAKLSPDRLFIKLTERKDYNTPPKGFNPPVDIQRDEYKTRMAAAGGFRVIQDVRQIPVPALPNQPHRTTSSSDNRRGMGSRTNSQADTRSRQQDSKGGVKMARTSSGRNQPQNQQQFTIPLNQIKPLEVTDKRWTLLPKIVNPTDESEREQLIFRKMRALLNKVTAENYERLLADVDAFQLDTKTIMIGVIKVIFDKALDEPKFGPFYARIAQYIQERFKVSFPEEAVNDKGEKTIVQIDFRRLLVNRCQSLFESKENFLPKPLTAEERASKTPADLEEYEYQRMKGKRHMLGNITFIGELYKLAMINMRIMLACIYELLEDALTPEESDIECLCNLLKTIGKDLDKQPDAQKLLNSYFDRMQRMSLLPNINSRTKFMLVDIVQLRKDKWIPRRAEAKIQKIDDVRVEAEAERNRASQSGGRNDRTSDRRSSGRAQGMLTIRDQRHQDFSKLATASHGRDAPTDTKLAPSKFVRVNPKAQAPQPAPTTVHANKFAMLLDQESEAKGDDDEEDDEAAQPAAASASAPAKSAAKAKPTIEAELEVEYKKMADEFMNSLDKENTLETLKELDGPEQGPRVMRLFYEIAFKAKDTHVIEQVASLVGYLMDKQIISRKDFISVLSDEELALDDIEEEYKKAPVAVGELIRAAVTGGGESLALLTDLEALTSSKWVDKAIAVALSSLVGPADAPERADKEMNVLEQLKGAELDLFEYVKDGQSISSKRDKYVSWLLANELAFLDAEATKLDAFRTALRAKLADGAAANDIATWLEAPEQQPRQSAPQFAGLLTLAVLEHATVESLGPNVSRSEPLSDSLREQEEELLGKYEPVLKSCVAEPDARRIQALLAIQAFCVTESFAQDLPLRLLRWFVDKGIIGREQVQAWKPDVGEMRRKTQEFLKTL